MTSRAPGNPRPWLLPDYQPTAGPACEKCARVGQVHDHHEYRCQSHVANRLGTSKTPPGWQCRQNRIRGLTVCGAHGGAAPQARAAGARNLERAALERSVTRIIRDLGESVDIRDGETIVAMRNRAVIRAVFYGRRVNELAEAELYSELYGPTGRPTGEAKPHVLIGMEQEERDRAAKLDEVCVKLGFESRRVHLAEAEIGALFDAVSRACAVLPAEAVAAFKEALAGELRAVAGPG